ncbi:preprotein translocase subunit SecA, partial [Escherichia coli]|nr:preprotein translocase subunit SecA [Escherichia coli]
MSVNESEERLLNFTKKTFLSMWSHSNIFYKKGKEFCDVMVVFGNDVIIMSDKLINYNIEIDEKIAWNRWYKSAIESSIKQLNGAYNHINSYPDNLYTDAQATEPFSMELPHSDEICIHLIAIANGCSNA